MPSLSFKQRLVRKARRVTKIYRRRWACMGQSEELPTRAVFVFGAQRSGSRLPIHVMERSPDILTFSEGHSRVFNGVLLKDENTLGALIERSPFPLVAFKPICDSHRAVALLDSFPEARAIWIYRHYRDVTHSASVKWKGGVEMLRRILANEVAPDDWRLGGVTAEKLELLRRYYDEQMSPHSAYALMWYLRNTLFFDLKLYQQEQVLLVNYEELVASPCEQFARMFQFLSCSFEPDFVKGVYTTSLQQRVVDIRDEIDELCEAVYQRLNRQVVCNQG